MSDSPSNWKVSGGGVALSLLLFTIAAVIVFAMWHSFRLFAGGEAVTGTVTAKKTSPGPKNTTNYTLFYSFTVDGKGFDGSSSLSQSDYDSLTNKGPVPLVYLPSAPAINSFEGVINDQCFGVVLASGGLGFLGLVVLAFSVRRRRPNAPAYNSY